jgi:hypothetical protein
MQLRLPLATAPNATNISFLAFMRRKEHVAHCCAPTNHLQYAVSSQSGDLHSIQSSCCSTRDGKESVRREGQAVGVFPEKRLSVPTFFHIVTYLISAPADNTNRPCLPVWGACSRSGNNCYLTWTTTRVRCRHIGRRKAFNPFEDGVSPEKVHLSPRLLKVSQSVNMLLGSMATRDACEETLRQPIYCFGAGKSNEQFLAIRECFFLNGTARAHKLQNVAHSARD